MLTLFNKKNIHDVANNYIIKAHIHSLPLHECIGNYADLELIESHPKFSLNMALISSSYHGYTRFVHYFISKGANPRTNHDQSITLAAGQGHLSIVKYLIKMGCGMGVLVVVGTGFSRADGAIGAAYRKKQKKVLTYLLSKKVEFTQ